MKALLPWPGVTGFKREMDEMLDRFFGGRGELFTRFGDWGPVMDVSETKDAYAVRAEMPGLEAKDVGLTLEGDVLTIKGEKKKEEESQDKDEVYYRLERSYGAFARSFHLPGAVDASKVTADFKNGVLTVMLPKTAAAKGTPIPVKEA